jgi:hypothetical protein
LLALPVLFIVLVEALLPLDPPLLRESHPVLLLLLRGTAGGLRPRRQRVRSGGIDVHRLQEETIKTNKNAKEGTKSKGKAVLIGPASGSIMNDHRLSSL